MNGIQADGRDHVTKFLLKDSSILNTLRQWLTEKNVFICLYVVIDTCNSISKKDDSGLATAI